MEFDKPNEPSSHEKLKCFSAPLQISTKTSPLPSGNKHLPTAAF